MNFRAIKKDGIVCVGWQRFLRVRAPEHDNNVSEWNAAAVDASNYITCGTESGRSGMGCRCDHSDVSLGMPHPRRVVCFGACMAGRAVQRNGARHVGTGGDEVIQRMCTEACREQAAPEEHWQTLAANRPGFVQHMLRRRQTCRPPPGCFMFFVSEDIQLVLHIAL